MKSLEQVMEELPLLTAFGIGVFDKPHEHVEYRPEFVKEREALRLAAPRVAEIALWIRENLVPQMRINKGHSSYGLKHVAERAMGSYVANGEFIAAAIIAGFSFRVVHDWPNAHFGITEKSVREADRKSREDERLRYDKYVAALDTTGVR